MPTEARTRPSPGAAFALGDFRRLFAGVTTSQLGDQFALIATPWLVLHSPAIRLRSALSSRWKGRRTRSLCSSAAP